MTTLETLKQNYYAATEMPHVPRCAYYQAGSVELCRCPRGERLRAARAAYRRREVTV